MPSFLEPPERMPPTSAKVYGYLAGEILRTRAKWIYYRQLFMDSERRVKKLSDAGNDFFGELQNILINDLILSLSRLTDPARIGQHENLTVALFIERLREESESALAEKLESKFAELSTSVESLRAHRKKRVAHHDLSAVTRPADNPLPPLTLRDMRVAIEVIEAFLSIAHNHFTNGAFLWDELRPMGDANALMVRLCMAECYDDAVARGLIERHAWREKWE